MNESDSLYDVEPLPVSSSELLNLVTLVLPRSPDCSEVCIRYAELPVLLPLTSTASLLSRDPDLVERPVIECSVEYETDPSVLSFT